jgi:L-histidine Nalpha-methyltransferase
MPASPAPAIDVRLQPADLTASLLDGVRAGLTSVPRQLSPTWLYDERGCELFEAITRLPEYYPTRTERAILAERANDLAACTQADTLIELGSGTSEKTRVILDALSGAGNLRRFVAFDVAESTLRAAADAIAAEYPSVEVTGVVGDFHQHVDALPRAGRRLIAFLGGTIGNFLPAERVAFLSGVRATLAPADALLLGADLRKDARRLVAAYDDAAGVTAAFNLNVLTVLNRELGADFDPAAFAHASVYDERHSRIEMRLCARRAQRVTLSALGLRIGFEPGEFIRTEVSTKFTFETVRSDLAAAGLRLVRWWTDQAGDYSLSLSVPRP